MDKATATRKFEEPPDDIHDTDATFHVNKSHIDPQDELAHVRNEFLERIEQAKAEATKIEEEMGEQIEEARIAGKQAAFSDLEDDRLSHTTMLATLHTMNEVWSVKETRSVHSDVVGSRPILLRRGPKPLSPLLRLLRRRMSREGEPRTIKALPCQPKKMQVSTSSQGSLLVLCQDDKLYKKHKKTKKQDDQSRAV